MKIVLSIFLLTICITNSYAQNIEKKLMGSWCLYSDYEFPDKIIFRSDHTYFIYNSNSVQAKSLGRKENLETNDILIKGAYTSMTEKGIWSYVLSTHELVLKNRHILYSWTDFSEAYGRGNEVRFSLNQNKENEIDLCYYKQGKKLCDKYVRDWSYATHDGLKISYKEISNTYVGVGKTTKEILLSGYETELQLSCALDKGQGSLIINDQNGKMLYSKGVRAAAKDEREIIILHGVTKLVFTVDSAEGQSKWMFSIGVK